MAIEGTERAEWINALGAVKPFDDSLIYLDRDGFGLLAPELDLVRFGGQQGASLAGMDQGPRSVALTALARGWSGIGLEDVESRLAALFDPEFGPGTLRIYKPSGAVRELRRVYYQGGLEYDTGQRWGTDILLVIRLLALDPWWYDPTVQQVVRSISDASAPTFPVTLPYTFPVAGATITLRAVNNGMARTWPRFRITGPATNPIITNATARKSFALALALAAGETLTVDMAPGARTDGVRVESGGRSTNVVGTRTGDSEFWALERGRNDVQVRLLDAVGATVAAEWEHAFKAC